MVRGSFTKNELRSFTISQLRKIGSYLDLSFPSRFTKKQIVDGIWELVKPVSAPPGFYVDDNTEMGCSIRVKRIYENMERNE